MKWPLVVLVAVLAVALLPSRPRPEDGKLNVLCTFLPMYVFALNVVGDVPDVDVQLLIERDVGCPHAYSLTGQDLKKISRADVIVANGLGIEPFLDVMLRGQSRAEVITIADECDVIREGTGEAGHEAEHDHGEAGHGPGCSHGKEGHQDGHVEHAATEPSKSDAHAGCDHDHGHGHDHGGGTTAPACNDPSHDHHDSDINPHTWVSPRQAMIEVRTLARKLGEIDADNADKYRANAEVYIERLHALAERMELAARGFTNRNIVTGHAAFDYLARDLNLNVVATLSVVPGETGSALEMARIIDAIRESKAAAVFQEPPFSDKLAGAIARDAGVPVYPLNPLNSDAGLTKPQTPGDARRMYEEAMEQNLATLQRALGGEADAATRGYGDAGK